MSSYAVLLPFYLKSLIIIFCITLFGCSESVEKTYTCNDELGCVKITPKDDIQLGVLQALSGGVAPLGQAQVRGLELAMDRRGGKLLGHRIALQVEDTGCTSEGGANAALKVIADPQTVAIFGTTCSGAAATASKAMSDAGLTMISGNNSAPYLTSIGGKAAPNFYPGFFRTAPNEENAGKTAAHYAYKELGVRKAATLHDNDIYTRGLVESFQKGFTELGGEIVVGPAVNKGDTIMTPVLHAVSSAGAELLFLPLFQPEGNNVVRQAKKINEFSEIILMGDGALIQESFLQDMGELAKGMYFVGPAKCAGIRVDELTERYMEKYDKEPSVPYYVSSFAAADLLFYAIENAVVHENDGNIFIGRQKLREILYATEKFSTVTGTLSCDQFGDCGIPRFNVLRLDSPEEGLKGLQRNIVFHSGRYKK